MTRNFFGLLIVVSTAFIMLVVGVLYWMTSPMHQVLTVSDFRPAIGSQVFALGDKPQEWIKVAEFHGVERRYVIPIDELPDYIVKAFVAAEDAQFFEHKGVNLVAIGRAFIANMKAGHVVQGGSTITQQVAKSLLLTPEKSIIRKLREFALATKIERTLSKNQILFLYLNQIYFGRGSYGIEAAARVYFKKHAKELSIEEAAFLAGMPQAPSAYNPLTNGIKAKERQRYVFRRMMETGVLSREAVTDLEKKPLYFSSETLKSGDSEVPHIVESVRRYVQEKYGEKKLYQEGLRIFLPLRVSVAASAHRALERGVRNLDKRLGFRGPSEKGLSGEKLKTKQEELRRDVISKRFKQFVLNEDGVVDSEGGLKKDLKAAQVENLFVKGELYDGIVQRWDPIAKSYLINLGGWTGVLGTEEMSWAFSDGKKPTLNAGDLIRVSVTETSKKGTLRLALEQEPEVEGALYSLDIQTGNTIAMVGGRKFSESEFNRATQALRQPGSAFKPFVFAHAVENGFTPSTIIVDAPLVFDSGEMGKWKPSNYEDKFFGDTIFRTAFMKSRNVPSIKVLQAAGLENFLSFFTRTRLQARLENNMSTALGSGGMSLDELVRGFAIFPRYGQILNSVLIEKIEDRDGNIIEKADRKQFRPLVSDLPPVEAIPAEDEAWKKIEASDRAVGIIGRKPIRMPVWPTEANPDQVMDPRVAFVMVQLMKDVVTGGTGFEARNLGKTSAGKTGTTSDAVDAWYVGFTPEVVTGVWIGFDRQKSIGTGETGAKAALPIWVEFMKNATEKSENLVCRSCGY